METAESNSSDSDVDNSIIMADVDPSSKRTKLDPSIPSTSSSNTSNADKATSSNSGIDKNKPNDDKETINKAKSGSSRFANRNYRKRSGSQSSSSTMDSISNTIQNDDINNTTNTNANENHEPNTDAVVENIEEETRSSLPNQPESDDSMSSDDTYSSLGQLEIQMRQISSDLDSSDSDASVKIDEKTNIILDRQLPRCDLNLVRNLIYRHGGIFHNGNQRIYDASANALTNRITGSIFSVERLSILNKLEKHHGCVNCLHFNKAGNLLVTGSDDLKVIIWNWAKSRPIIIQSSGHTSNVFQSKFIDNGKCDNQSDFNLITSARDGEVRQIQVGPDGNVRTRAIVRHVRPVHKIAIPDSNPNEILTAGEDAIVNRTDLRDKNPEKLLMLRVDGNKVPLYSIAAHPFDPEFCVCGRDQYVRVYDKRNVKECVKLFCPEKIAKNKLRSINITCAVYNYLGNEILATYSDENIYLFDNTTNTPGSYLHTYIGHKNYSTIKGVNFFGPCSEFIMSGSDCGNFFMWEKNSEAIVQWLRGDDEGVVNCLEGHPNFPILATSGLDHSVKIWGPINPDGRPSKADLKQCIKGNIRLSDHLADLNLLQYFFRDIPHRSNPRDSRERTSGDSSSEDTFNFGRYLNSDENDDDDDDDNIYGGFGTPGSCATS